MEQLGTYNQQPVHIAHHESITTASVPDVEGKMILLWVADPSWTVEYLQPVLEGYLRARAAGFALAGARAEEFFGVVFDTLDVFGDDPRMPISVFADQETADIVREFLRLVPEPPAQLRGFHLIVVGAADVVAPVRSSLSEHVRKLMAGV